MVKWILKTIVGNKNQREIKKILPLVDRINELEVALQSEPEEALKERTREWQEHRDRILQPPDSQASRY